MKSSQSGFSIIELSASIVILGLIISALIGLYTHLEGKYRHVDLVQSIQEANEAIAGFIFSKGRLPCPSVDNNGSENCTIAKGFLPYKALGMPTQIRNSAGLALRYAVYLKTDTMMQDTELDILKDRYRPFIADGSPPVGQEKTLGNLNNLDFCQALNAATAAPDDSTLVHVGNAGSLEHVAYLLLDPGAGDADGDGNSLDEVNAVADLAFDRPNFLATFNNDDRVFVTYFNQLWGKLGCSSVISPAGHAHPNAATSAAIMQQSMADYEKQLILNATVAAADVLAASASLASALAGVATATSASSTALSETLVSKGVTVGIIAIAAVADTAAAAAVVLATAAEAAAIANAAVVAGEATAFAIAMVTRINNLSVSVRTNANAADKAGLFVK
jgi:prepilin-type N-terminal cleavage/methylation domain-containing protein